MEPAATKNDGVAIAPPGAGKTPGKAARTKGIEVRVSYAGECSLEEAVSRYLAARANAMAIPALAEAGA